MDSELNLLLNAIKQRTGIDIVVFGESRKFIAATAPGMEAVLPSDPDFEGIFRDDRTRRTYFRLKYKTRASSGRSRGRGKWRAITRISFRISWKTPRTANCSFLSRTI